MKQLLGVLLLVGVILVYWKIFVGILLVVALWKLAPRVWGKHVAVQAARRERVAAIIARADQQNRWAMAGDLRGTYGAYPTYVSERNVIGTEE